MSLTAAIEVAAGQPDARALVVELGITNPSDRRITILNPDMGVPSPAMNWPYSKEVYQTFLLMSFGYLSMLVTDEAGKELPQQVIPTSATPALRRPIELGAGDSFKVAIPIGSFYQLESKKAYRVAIEYGDQKLKVSARSRVIVP
jgi:hypothetical protein